MAGKTTKHMTLALAVAGALLLVPGAAQADIDPGVRGGFYEDADAGFIGAELLWGLTQEWYLNPNFEYVFVDDGDLYTLNLDAHYDFPVQQPFYVWAGAGAAVIRSDLDCRNCDSETDFGLNVLGGIGFGKGQALRPYVQGKLILSDETEAVIAVGLRFN